MGRAPIACQFCQWRRTTIRQASTLGLPRRFRRIPMCKILDALTARELSPSDDALKDLSSWCLVCLFLACDSSRVRRSWAAAFSR
jgi:hypothetical protein